MLKLVFTNAVAKDHGYGLEVNGKSLVDIISTALGTRVGNTSGYGSGLPSFESNACDITVIIDPHSQDVLIEDDENVFYSVAELEQEAKDSYERDSKKDAEAES